MNCFLTGVTGFIGSSLARRLVTDGHHVNAIIRNPDHPDLPKLKNIHYYRGDLDNKRVLADAMLDCDVTYHLAAYAKPWSKNPDDYHRINVEGAVNVFSAARDAGVKKVVFTSSAATMSPSRGHIPTNESTERQVPYFNAYESTKAEAEQKAIEFSQKGLHVVIVNPSRVYGPGPINPSNSVTQMIIQYDKGKWRIIPGNGKMIGNYVFIDDVVEGHILAAKRGRSGERYILGGENHTFDQFFHVLRSVCGKTQWMFHLPLPVMLTVARIMEGQAKITGIAPLITGSFVKKYLNHWSLSSEKAMRELAYHITPLDVGVKHVLDWSRP